MTTMQADNRNLLLYYRPTCPFCVKVLNYLDRQGISVPLCDISGNDEAVGELIRLGGKRQVPCLAIDGVALYESDDIIAWFTENR